MTNLWVPLTNLDQRWVPLTNHGLRNLNMKKNHQEMTLNHQPKTTLTNLWVPLTNLDQLMDSMTHVWVPMTNQDLRNLNMKKNHQWATPNHQSKTTLTNLWVPLINFDSQ
ncbi:hypothetical protein WISP_00821 [Willisornis vidua]|uniref:Uncharacterized protein n=1 Tax=Willisornis vidua TaxID=1566151 RepID=A0ABQ9DY51_9PASS|nr:hypothetical protein WISP_00821 [Willisornis vidua]